MTKRVETDVDNLVNIFTNISKSELDQYIGKQCYLKFTGNCDSWGIDLEDGTTVLRCQGEEYEVSPNVFSRLPGNKPQIFNIEQTQKAWGHNKEGKYVPDCIKFRIYKSDSHECIGRPAGLNSVVII